MPNLHQLTGTELDKTSAATDYLLNLNDKCHVLEPLLAAKLDTLRSDLTAEREDRANLAKS